LTVVLVAPISHAAPSCCDPNNGSTLGAMLAPGQPTRATIPAASPQQRVATPQVTPAMVRATGSNWSGPVPQGQVAASRAVGLPNAPAVPSCCAVPNNSGPARGINPSTQAQFRGCGCSGGTGGPASYSRFQPASGPVQFTSNPPSTGQQAYPAGQASCCPTTGPSNNQGGWNASRPVFRGLW
jgi:hypothetical protein